MPEQSFSKVPEDSLGAQVISGCGILGKLIDDIQPSLVLVLNTTHFHTVHCMDIRKKVRKLGFWENCL